MLNQITMLQAFKSMICFLDDYYNKTFSDDLGALLGDMQLHDNGTTWDPATWNDWIVALENKKSVTIAEGFKGMFVFLNEYYKRTSSASKDLKILLDIIQDVMNKKHVNSIIWNTWTKCVEKNC